MSSIQVTVALDEDVLARLKQESDAQGTSLDEAVNKLLREGLSAPEVHPPKRRLRIKPFHSGPPKVNLDCTEALLEYAEGTFHR